MADRAEQLLMEPGFHQIRVRMHGMMARIEILPEEFCSLLQPAVRERVYREFREYGFEYAAMDLKGYRYKTEMCPRMADAIG